MVSKYAMTQSQPVVNVPAVPSERSRAWQSRRSSLPLWLLPSFLMADGCFIKRGGLTRHLVDSLRVPDIRFTFYLPIQSAFHPVRPGNVTMETCSVVYQKIYIYIYINSTEILPLLGGDALLATSVTAHKDLSEFKTSRRTFLFLFLFFPILTSHFFQLGRLFSEHPEYSVRMKY